MSRDRGEGTMYFTVKKGRPDLVGTFVGEILNDRERPTLYLRPPGGRRLAEHGKGDVVVTDISRKGWQEIGNLVADLGPEARMSDVKDSLTEAPLMTWDRPSDNR